MRTVGNILWLVFAGFWTAVEWLIVGVVLCLTVVGIPFGVQCFKLAHFVVWPFGRKTVHHRSIPILGAVGKVLWFIFAGIWLAVSYLIAGVLLCMTVIGIPFGFQAFQLARLALTPFGRKVVHTRDFRRFI